MGPVFLSIRYDRLDYLRVELVDHIQQIAHWRTIGRVVAGIDQPQSAVLVYDKVTTELGSVVAVRVVTFLTGEPSFEIDPARFQAA